MKMNCNRSSAWERSLVKILLAAIQTWIYGYPHHENVPIQFWPLKPHLYIVKLRFTGVCVIFLISAQNIDCGYSLDPPRWGGSNDYPQSMFWAELWKISEFFIWKVSFFGDNIFSIFEQARFRNAKQLQTLNATSKKKKKKKKKKRN